MFRAILYGGGTTLLLIDVYFLVEATLTRNFVPIVPILAGIFTAGGLLFIVYAEQRAREDDKKAHRRIARVSHQLTTPLQMLQDDLADLQKNSSKLPSKQRMQLKRMATKSKVVLDNIRDVFLALQAQEGTIAQEIKVQDVCEIVDELYLTVSPLASAHNVTLRLKKHCPQAVVKVDKHLFKIALTHVIENAIFYSLTPGQVNVSITKGKNYTRIIVEDRGLGITDQDSDIVFRPFARGEESAKYEPDGIGIGLALTKLILKEFRGSITWQNKTRGTGTQFVIRLPLLKTT